MTAFEFPTVDLMIAYGSTLAELFENAAYGTAARAGIDGAGAPLYDVPVMAIGDSPEDLLADWLIQLGERAAEARLTFSSFTIARLEEGGVQGAASGYRGQTGASWAEWTVEVVVAAGDGFWARLRSIRH